MSEEGLDDGDETEDDGKNIPADVATLNNWDTCLGMLCDMGTAAETGQEDQSVRKFAAPDPKGCTRVLVEAVLEKMRESDVEMPFGVVSDVLDYFSCWESTWPVPKAFRWCVATFIDVYKREYDSEPEERSLGGLHWLKSAIAESEAREYRCEMERDTKPSELGVKGCWPSRGFVC